MKFYAAKLQNLAKFCNLYFPNLAKFGNFEVK